MKRTSLARDALTGVVLVALIALCLGTAFGLLRRQAPASPPTEPSGTADSEGLFEPPVETALIAEQRIEATFTRRGSLEPSSQVSVYAEVTGRVLKRNVAVGDPVKDGDALVELDGELLKIRLDEAQARLASAQSQLDEAKAQVESAEKSEDDDLKRDAKLRRDAAEAAVNVAKTQVAEAQARYDSRIVHSPTDGVVAQVWVDEGEFAAAERPVAEIVVTDPIAATVALTELEVASLPGEVKCRVVVPEAGGTVPARLVHVAPVADPLTKRFSARVELDNGQERLRAGTPVDVTFDTASRKPVLVMPRRALTSRNDALVCFRIEAVDSEGHVARPVQPQFESIPGRPDLLRVLAGLKAGDEVATSGLILLDDGLRVRPVRHEEPEPPKEPEE